VLTSLGSVASRPTCLTGDKYEHSPAPQSYVAVDDVGDTERLFLTGRLLGETVASTPFYLTLGLFRDPGREHDRIRA